MSSNGPLADLDVAGEVVEERLHELWRRIDDEPKSGRWRLRARVGGRAGGVIVPALKGGSCDVCSAAAGRCGSMSFVGDRPGARAGTAPRNMGQR